MKILNKNGITILEAVASVIIVSFVMISAFTILINIRNQTRATQEEIQAIEVGERIRDNIINDVTYNDLFAWVNGGTKSITKGNCSTINPPFDCNIIVIDILGEEFDNPYTITFYKPTVSDIEYQVIHFSVEITYYFTNTVELTGIIYE